MYKKYSYYSIDAASWENRDFNDADVVHLYTNNKDVLTHNNRNIVKVGNPIALVESENIGNAKSMNNENFGNLSSSIYLYVSTKVSLSRNYLNVALSNGSVSIIKEIIYDSDNSAPALPKFIIVDFGKSYMDKVFFQVMQIKKVSFPYFLSVV